jgi:dihydroorotase
MALYATAFEAQDRLDRLEAFASLNGPRFYGLAPNRGTITLERCEAVIPQALAVDGTNVVPLAAGETLGWRLRG